LQTKISHDQEAQFNYAKSHNLPMSNESNQNVELQRMIQLGTQLADAEKERKLAEGLYEHAKGASDPLSIPEVMASPRIIDLRQSLESAKAKRESLLFTYTPEWPEVKKIDEQIKWLEAELKGAISEAISTLR